MKSAEMLPPLDTIRPLTKVFLDVGYIKKNLRADRW